MAEKYTMLTKLLMTCIFLLTTHIFDNDLPQSILDSLTTSTTKVQLVPPNFHWSNKAERAIQTFKAHLISGLNSCPPSFPKTQWHQLLKQANIIINILCQSNNLPHLSVYHHISGLFNPLKTPIAPPGLEILIHEKMSIHKTWAPRIIKGHYLGWKWIIIDVPGSCHKQCEHPMSKTLSSYQKHLHSSLYKHLTL